MAYRIVRQLVLGGILASLAVLGACRRDAGGIAPSELIPAEQLSETEVVPHLEGPIAAGKNYVYCATFQLAWNQFQDEILGEPASLSGSSSMVQGLLHGKQLSTDILPPGSYLIKAGWAKDGVVDQIRGEMRRRFPHSTLEMPSGSDPHAAVAYAYLVRQLAFREAFDRLAEPVKFQCTTGTVPVASFGVRYFNRQSFRARALSDQVTVLDYVSNDDFIVRLNTTSKEDEMILARIPPGETLAATLAAMQQRIKQPAKDMGPQILQDRETLAVPIIDLSILRRYGELEGKALTNGMRAGLKLDVAAQAIRFRLDENGARLESSAYQGWKNSMSSRGPRQLVFDKPFLVCLKRVSRAEPYLAIWIETPEVLQRAE